MKSSQAWTHRALGLIEVLITLSVIAVISAVAHLALSGAPQGAHRALLQHQVEALNAATRLYESSGGSLAGLVSPVTVIAKLKTVASNGEKLPGFRGSLVDPRLQVTMQTAAEAALPDPRVLWNPSLQRFVLVESGSPGIRAFSLSRSDTAVETMAEHRESTWEFSATDAQGNWVWDYNRDTSDSVSGAFTLFAGSPGSGSADPGLDEKEQLQPPIFSPASGHYPHRDYDLSVELANPNPPGSSIMYVSVNGDTYKPYLNPVTVAPDTTVVAFCEPSDEDYYSSYTRLESYRASGIFLAPPQFAASPDGCCDSDYPKSLIMTNPNEGTESQILYRMNGGEEQLYEGPIALPGNTEVSAYCHNGVDEDVYDSEVETRTFESRPPIQLAMPAVSPDGGEHEDVVVVTLTAAEDAPAGSRIFYTTDGTDPGVDEMGEPLRGTLYSEPLTLTREGNSGVPGHYLIDWDTDLWNDGEGWLDNEWNLTQTLTDIGGSGVDVAVSLFGGPPAGDVPGPNLASFSPLGPETILRSTAGDIPDFYYSLRFSEAIGLDTFSSGGLFTFFDEMLANRIDLYDPAGNQISLDSGYVSDYEHARVDVRDGGIETVGTSAMNDPIVDSERSTTRYDFAGLAVSELRWWHYAYEVSAGPSYQGTREPVPGSESVTVGNDTVTFGGVLYDYPEEGISTWFYIVESGEKPEISHVTFDISEEYAVEGGVDGAGTWSGTFPNVTLNSGGGDPQIGYDKKTAAWGLKYDEGFSAYEEKRFYFTVDGNYERTSIPVLTKAGNASDSAPITGPGLQESLDQSVSTFTLIDTGTGQPVPGHETLETGCSLDLAYLPSNFTIRANTNPTVVGSVRFSMDGAAETRVENQFPYSLTGDSSGEYAPWNPTIGAHSLTATPYSEEATQGQAGIPGMIEFSVINSAEKIGHDKSSFLGDIAFHVDGSHEVVARVYPPSGDGECTFASEPVRKVFTITEPAPGS